MGGAMPRGRGEPPSRRLDGFVKRAPSGYSRFLPAALRFAQRALAAAEIAARAAALIVRFLGFASATAVTAATLFDLGGRPRRFGTGDAIEVAATDPSSTRLISCSRDSNAVFSCCSWVRAVK